MAIGRPVSLTSNVAAKNISVTATASQTLFTVTGGYRINQIAVFRNGVRLVDGSDYTARDGTSVTLLSAATGGDVIEFQIFDDFRVADALDVNSGGTVNGNIYVGSGTTLSPGGINVTGVVTATSFFGGDATFSGNVSVAGTISYDDVTNVDSVGVITARSDIQVGGGLSVTGISTLSSTTIVGSAVTINATGIDAIGVVTATGGFNLGISSAGTSVTSSPVTTLNFIGAGNTFAVSGTTVDISIAGGGGGGGGDGSQFNTGISTTVIATPTGIGSTVLTLPSTADKRYLVYSVFASNVATGNTEVNIIGAFDFDGGSRSYFGYNIPIPTGTSIELLEQPQILNPSDRITVRSTDYSRAGTDDIVKVFITYEEKDSTDYFGVGINTVGLGTTAPVGVYTSSTNPSVVQSIRLVNRTDTGSYPVTVDITSGVTTTKLVDNLIVPKYGSVELLAQPKRLLTNDEIKVTVDQASTIDVQISGKQIS